MPKGSNAALKVVFAVIQAKSPIGLNQLSKRAHLAKSLVLYHLPRLIQDGIIIKQGKRYTCQPFYKHKDTREDLADAAKVLITMLTKELIITPDTTEDELSEHILQNTITFIRLYKEGLLQ